ncbi:SDR family oxidoreductase [Candidatus Pacearchaeota archaeon]|nr:SDR family oxidoreductase [Candidatus Pacearchaeota archaeon]
MKLLVFGSTGGTGKEIVKQALEKKYKVIAFARSSEKLQNIRGIIEIVKGDVRNQEDVDKAVKNSNVILSALGTKLFEKPICEIGVKNIINSMKKYNKNRIIVESAYGVKETRKKGMYAKFLWFLIKQLLIDKEKMEAALENSNLDWTIVQPVLLTNEMRKGNYITGEAKKAFIKGFQKISRADVADCMIKLIPDKKSFHKKLVVF